MVDNLFLEQCIIKTMMQDDEYAFLVASTFQKDYFETVGVGSIFFQIKSNLKQHNELPQKDIIINSVNEKEKDDVKTFFKELDNIDYDTNKNYDWLLEETNNYLKDKAIKTAIIKSVDIIDENKPVQQIRELIEDALCKDLKIDLGSDYFDDFGLRLKRILEGDDNRVPSYFPVLDEYLNGGFIPYSLSVIGAPIHKGKSLFMANMATRMAEHGKNVVLMSMEMSEDSFAQRFDSIYSKCDINKIYINKKIRTKMMKEIITLKEKNVGKLFIKEFATGKATVNDFRIYLRELRMRKISIDILFVDYINLLMAENVTGNSYVDVKKIAEDLRALSLEFKIPIITATQINRDGSKLDLKEIDTNYISESMGIAATADFVIFLGDDEDKFTYENEIHYKVGKNRLGGRVGEVNKFYIDTRSLKMYCESEHQMWIDDAKISNDSRETKNVN